MTDEELRNLYKSSAVDAAQQRGIGTDNLDGRLAELQAAGLRAVFNAGLTRAAEIARRQDYRDKLPVSTEGDRTSDARARSIAAAIDAEKEKGND